MGYSFPNQRTIKVHKTPFKNDFLGIKNEVWKAACRNLRPHAFVLYLYFASNADGYMFSLSPSDIQEQIGLARSTYHDQIKILIQKGYLVPSHGNTFDFYDEPRVENKKEIQTATVGQSDQPCPIDGNVQPNTAKKNPPEDIETNKNIVLTHKSGTNIDKAFQQMYNSDGFVF